MHSSQYPYHPGREPAGDAPPLGTLEDLIVQTRRLREGVDLLRRGEPEHTAARDVRRAVWDLAVHQLADFGEQLEQLERCGAPPAEPAARVRLGQRTGSAEWSLLTDQVVWSEELFGIFGRPPEEGPLTLDQLPSLLVAEDQPGLTSAVTRCLVDGRPVSCEFRIMREDGTARTLQLAGEPILDDGGSTVAMWAMVRDISELGAARERRPGAGARPEPGAAGGVRGAGPDGGQSGADPGEPGGPPPLDRSGHRLAIALQESAHARWLGPTDRAARPGVPRSLELAACLLPAGAGAPREGKWHDWLELPDGGSVLSVGDLSGRGPAAATGTASTLGALRGISLTGASPGSVLEYLNELLDRGSHPVLASLACCRYRPADGSLVWAQAGHPAPLLCRSGSGRFLQRPAGTLLGAIAGTVYAEGTERLETGDTLVLYTDGLFAADPAGTRAPDGSRGTDPRLLALAPALTRAPSAREALRRVLRSGPPADARGGGDGTARTEDACLLVARVS